MKTMLFVILFMISFNLQADELTFHINPKAEVQNGVSELSCKQIKNGGLSEGEQPEIKPSWFNLDSLSIDWQGVGFITPSIIEIEIRSVSLESENYLCQIQGDELMAVLPQAIYSGTSVQAACELRCGNVKLKPGVVSTELYGQLTFYGKQISAYGIDKIVYTRPITLSYQSSHQ